MNKRLELHARCAPSTCDARQASDLIADADTSSIRLVKNALPISQDESTKKDAPQFDEWRRRRSSRGLAPVRQYRHLALPIPAGAWKRRPERFVCTRRGAAGFQSETEMGQDLGKRERVECTWQKRKRQEHRDQTLLLALSHLSPPLASRTEASGTSQVETCYTHDMHKGWRAQMTYCSERFMPCTRKASPWPRQKRDSSSSKLRPSLRLRTRESSIRRLF